MAYPNYSALKLQLMATGQNSGTWGNVTNVNLEAVEEAITGSADVTFASNNQTLSASNTNSSQDFRNLRLNLTGTTGGSTRTLTVPDIEKVYIVNNTCGDAVQVKNSTGSNISVPAGKTMYLFSTGSNVVDAVTHLTSLTLASPLPIASGGTGSNATAYSNLASNVFGVLPIANGGTGSSAGPNVSTVSGVLPVLNGGTGSNIASFSGANITSLNATNISTGTLDIARGGTGINAVGTAGNLLTSNGTAWISSAPAASGLISGTAQSLVGQNSVNFTSLPSGIKKLTVIIRNASTNGTSIPVVRIGAQNSIASAATFYLGTQMAIISGGNPGSTADTTGVILNNSNAAANVYQGTVEFTALESNYTWAYSAQISLSNTTRLMINNGTIALGDYYVGAAELSNVRLTTINGTDTYDAGTINIVYQL
jgi:hypothetical protein